MARADNFNRTASPLGTPSDGGSAWEVIAGAWETDGSVARSTTGGATAVLECGAADGEVSATLNSAVGTSLMFRVADDNNKLIVVMSAFDAPQFYTRIGGAYTAIGTNTGAFASNGSTIKVVMAGSDFTAYIDDVAVATASSSFNLTATKHGLGAAGTSAEFDDFAFTGSGGGSPTPQNPFLLLGVG